MTRLIDRRRNAIATAGVLYVAIFVTRATVGTAGDAISFLYVIPTVLVAVSLGLRGGLIAAAVAFALSSLGSLLSDLPVTALGYVNRAVVYLFIGGLVGRFADDLRRLERDSARHFNLSRDMICIAGFDGEFKEVNPAFEETLGFRREELVGRPFLEFVHPEDRERTEREAAAISDGNAGVQFQNRYYNKAGEVHWIEWNSVPLQDEGLIYAVARDVTDRKELEEELERLSQRDPLTGLFNRRRFEEELRRQLVSARRYRRPGALLAIDLDGFKQVNDRLGHAVGDEALREVGRVLGESLRASDAVVARLGGDEFVALLPEVDGAGASAVARRLVAAIREASFVADGQAVRLGASIGVALFDEFGIPAEVELLAAADLAMYEAKSGGGDGFALAGRAGAKPSRGSAAGLL
jgi:diguanylate cyclase